MRSVSVVRMGVGLLLGLLLISAGIGAAPVTLRVVGPFTTGEQVFRQLVAEFEAAYPDIKIDVQVIAGWDQNDEQFKVTYAAGAAPDVVFTESRFFYDMTQARMIEPLNNWMNRVPEMSTERFFPTALASATFGGTVYGIPVGAGCYIMHYNQNLFDKVGLAGVPSTYEDVRNYARKLKSVPTITNAVGHFWNLPGYLTFLYSFGGRMYTPEGKVAFDQPEAIAALQWMAEDALELGVSLPAASRSFNNYWRDEKTAIIYGSSVYIPWTQTNAPSVNHRAALMPWGPAGRTGWASSQHFVIVSTSKHKNEAWTFLQWFLADKPQGAWTMAAGFLPAKMSVFRQPAFRENPIWGVFADQLMYTLPWPEWGYKFAEVRGHIEKQLTEVWNGRVAPRQALETAAALSRQALANDKQ